MKKIRLTGTFCNAGYGVANKATFQVLKHLGVVKTNIINTPMSRAEFAQDKEYIEIRNSISTKQADINIVQLVPNLWHYGFQKGSYNIGAIFWETDRISQQWIDIINNGMCDEIWVPCPSNYNALINSGITKPIKIVPQYTPINTVSKEEACIKLPIPNEGKYTFYSIFQWTERKNPEALLKAYFAEFTGKDDVILVVKTYGPNNFSDKRWIQERIVEIKKESGSNAPLYLLGDLLTPKQVDAIAPQCDCYITTTRGEGHNIPLLEAMNYNHQTITPKTGGIADWIDNEAYVIPHKLIDIDTSKQAWGQFYISNPPQKWGDVEIDDVKKFMRQAYNERDVFSPNYEKILSNVSLDCIIKTIKDIV